jgi:hypothetical protein
VPVYWIVDVADRLIEVCTQPGMVRRDPVYRERVVYGIGETARGRALRGFPGRFGSDCNVR